MTWNLLASIRKARKSLSLLAAISTCLLSAFPAKAGTTITPLPGVCPVVINQPGEYDLAGNVGPCLLGDGIDIVASGVTLHLNGHTITGGTPCDAAAGIHVGLPATPIAQVRILGPGTISAFQTAFLGENSAGSFVKFVTATVSAVCPRTSNPPFAPVGFSIPSSSSQWKLDGNVVRGDDPLGTVGIFLAGNDNDLVRNDVNDTILLQDSSNNTIVNNTSHDGIDAIVLSAINTGSNQNELHANTTNNNINDGVRVIAGSLGNNITGNTSMGNRAFDLEDENPNCDNNKWEGNHFNTANQSCIH